MPNVSHTKNVGAYLKAAAAGSANTAGAPILLVAGGAGDAVQDTGPAINRAGSGSCSLVVAANATLAAAATLSFAVDIQDAVDSAFTAVIATEVLQASAVLLTGGGGGTDEVGVLKLDVDLSGKAEFVRFRITPDFSAASLDTGHYNAACVLGGDDVVPSA